MISFDFPQSQLDNKLAVPHYEVKNILDNLNQEFDTVSIGDCAKVASGSYVPEYVSDGVPYIRVNSIREFQFNLNEEDTEYVDPKHPDLTDRVFIEEEDVVIPRTGSLGNAAIATHDTVGTVMSQHVTRITFEDIDPYYATVFLNTDFGKEQMLHSGHGSTRKELTHKSLKRIEIPIIEEEIQTISDLIKKAKQAEYQGNKKIQEALNLFRQGIGIDIDSLPDNDIYSIGESAIRKEKYNSFIPKHYKPKYQKCISQIESNFECITLDEVAEIERGRGTTVDEYSTEGIPFIRTSDLINWEIDPYPDHYATLDTYQQFDQESKQYDILYSIEGKVGQSAILLEAEKCVFKNHIERIRVIIDSLDPVFVFLFLNTEFGEYQVNTKEVVQTTIPGIAGRIREVIVPIRPKDSDDFNELIYEAIKTAKEGLRLKKKKKTNLAEAKDKIGQVLGSKIEQ
ncbi:restriction endonuclease subunit S [Natrialbaceae archaeon A-CW2]